jgi:Tol biopolymer transport system component/DNA-binding winged helix-turn-helix (wHTH) protein
MADLLNLPAPSALWHNPQPSTASRGKARKLRGQTRGFLSDKFQTKRMSNPVNRIYEFGSFRLDVAERRLLRAGEPVKLAPKEFDLLVLLVEHAGRALKKDDLLSQLWPDVMVEEGTLTRNVSRLRTVLGELRDGEKFIETLPKFGYRFLAEVTQKATVIPPQLIEPVIIENLASKGLPRTAEPAAPTVPHQPATQPASVRTRALLGWTVAATALLLCVGLGIYVFRAKPAPPKSEVLAKIVPFTGLAGRENHPAFSPDGRQLAFTWRPDGSDNFDIYVKLIGAGEPLRLTQHPGTDVFPAWSPDGRFIAWVRSHGEFNEIFVMPALGGIERRIFKTRQAVWSSLSWSRDGKQLAIADGQDKENQSGIFLISIETGEALRVTTPPPRANDSWPAFSPDGQAIAFRRVFHDSLSELWVSDAPGREPRKLTAEQAVIEGFTWMPDGTELLYSLNRNGSASLYRISRDAQPESGKAQPFGAAGRKAFFPAISPDGQLVAFVEPLDDANIWQLLPSGKPRKFIASNHADHSAQISPDGRHIVFVSDRSGGEELWTCLSDGSNQEQLTHRNVPTGSPRWSPDGRWIVFDSREDGNSELFIISAEGSPPRRLTNDKASDSLPCWSHDGQSIYFRSNRSGSQQLWRMPAQGGAAVQLTQQGVFESFASPDGKFVYYSKGRGVAGLWRAGVDGANEQSVPELSEAGYWRAWMITPQGLYYVARNDTLPLSLKLFNFATQQSRIVATTEHAPAWLPHSLGVSADGRQILFTQSDLFSSSILLMKDYR